MTAAKSLAETKQDESEAKSTRASVSFPPVLYQSLEQMAKDKKVSIAWIVREATEKYVADQYPLFSDSK